MNFMERAIELAKEGVNNDGGPFGAVVVKDGKIIAEAYNEVTLTNDPTAHAEVLAIKRACKVLSTLISPAVTYTVPASHALCALQRCIGPE